ncbi:MAG: transcriptional repressor [Bacilli bacterium]|nr:transcriptional repressor [Bacilli bacterium]
MKYKTKQKELILQFLKENKDKCLTVKEIKTNFDLKQIIIGQTTIYRYLSNLEEQGIISKYINNVDNSSSYQYITDDCHLHFHLKCIKCGKIIHLECLKLNDLEKHIIEKHDFKIDNFKTVIYGLCSKCK